MLDFVQIIILIIIIYIIYQLYTKYKRNIKNHKHHTRNTHRVRKINISNYTSANMLPYVERGYTTMERMLGARMDHMSMMVDRGPEWVNAVHKEKFR